MPPSKQDHWDCLVITCISFIYISYLFWSQTWPILDVKRELEKNPPPPQPPSWRDVTLTHLESGSSICSVSFQCTGVLLWNKCYMLLDSETVKLTTVALTSAPVPAFVCVYEWTRLILYFTDKIRSSDFTIIIYSNCSKVPPVQTYCSFIPKLLDNVLEIKISLLFQMTWQTNFRGGGGGGQIHHCFGKTIWKRVFCHYRLLDMSWSAGQWRRKSWNPFGILEDLHCAAGFTAESKASV